MKYTSQGDAVTSFSLATNRKWAGSDGQPGEETTWFNVSVWGKQAEACNQYLSKGRQVYIEGRLNVDKATGGPRIWTDNEGNPRASFEIRALSVKFLQSGTQNEQQAQTQQYAQPAPQQAQPQTQPAPPPQGQQYPQQQTQPQPGPAPQLQPGPAPQPQPGPAPQPQPGPAPQQQPGPPPQGQQFTPPQPPQQQQPQPQQQTPPLPIDTDEIPF